MSFIDAVLLGLSAAWDRVHESFSSSPVGSPVTCCALEAPPRKTVSAKAQARLSAAQEAMAYAKEKLPHGAGNQVTALQATNLNSFYRAQVSRDKSAFNIPAKVVDLAHKNPVAFAAAKAELAQGGNCGEHARLAYDYLRRKYPGEHIQLSQKEGLDHAFVLIGDPVKEGAAEVVVADAWPTKATPVLWEDHFAYEPDAAKILNQASSQGDGRDYKQEMLDAGLSLNAKGKADVQKSLTEVQTSEQLNRASELHLWNHQDTAAKDRSYQYVSPGASGGGVR